METVKLKIVSQPLRIQWECPSCSKTNIEYNYKEGESLCCYGCGKLYNGEIEKGERK